MIARDDRDIIVELCVMEDIALGTTDGGLVRNCSHGGVAGSDNYLRVTAADALDAVFSPGNQFVLRLELGMGIPIECSFVVAFELVFDDVLEADLGRINPNRAESSAEYVTSWTDEGNLLLYLVAARGFTQD
jgi:hypothetical protein